MFQWYLHYFNQIIVFGFEKRIKSLRICVAKWLLIVHNAFNLLSTELLVGREWISEGVISDLCIEVVCTMRVIGFNS